MSQSELDRALTIYHGLVNQRLPRFKGIVGDSADSIILAADWRALIASRRENPRWFKRLPQSLKSHLEQIAGETPDIGLVATAIVQTAEHFPPRPTPRHARASLARVQRLIEERTHPGQRHKRHQSEALAMGTSSHRMLQELIKVNGNLALLSGHQTQQLALPHADNHIYQATIAFPPHVKQLDFLPHLPSRKSRKKTKDHGLPETVTLHFPVALYKPPLPETNNLWLTTHLSASFRALGDYTNNRLPASPAEVVRLFSSQPHAQEIIYEISELLFLIYGYLPDLMPIFRNDDSDPSSYCFNYGRGEELAIIDLLSVARLTLEASRTFKSGQSTDTCALTELHVGPALFRRNGSVVDLGGGKMDVVRFRLLPNSAAPEEHSAFASRHDLSQLSSILSKAKAKDFDGSLTKLINQLAKWGYADALFNLGIEIDDHKFAGGDALDVNKSLDPNSLPLAPHIDQINDYLLFILSKLVIKTVKKSNGSRIALTPEEIYDECLKHGYLSQVSARLSYHFPDKTRVFISRPPTSRQQFLDWANTLIDRQLAQLTPEEASLAPYAAALARLISQAPISQKIVETPSYKKLPSYLSDLCHELIGAHYLDYETLAQMDLTNGVFYEAEGVIVLYGKLGDYRYRISINKFGEFYLKAIGHKGSVRGTLLESFDTFGLSIDSSPVFNLVLTQLFSSIPTPQVLTLSSCDTKEDWIVEFPVDSPVGHFVDRVALLAGESPPIVKPDLCTLNPFDGSYILHVDRLANYITTLAGPDRFHLRSLYLAVERGIQQGMFFCPGVGHNDKEHEGCYLHGDTLYCFGCKTVFHIQDRFRELAPVALFPDVYTDYYPVLPARRQVYETTVALAQHFYQSLPEGAAYLEKRRGIIPTPTEHIGFLPKTLTRLLTGLARNKYLNLEQYADSDSLTNIPNTQLPNLLKQISSPDAVASLLTFDYFRLAAQQGFLFPLTKDAKALSVDTLYDTIILPMRFPDPTSGELELANIMARAIDDRSRNQIKAPIPRDPVGLLQADGTTRWYNPAHPGYFFPDAQNFPQAVADSRLVVVVEGGITGLSFKRLFPDLGSVCVAMCGTGYTGIPTLIRWLCSHQNISPEKLTVMIATDFDKPGQDAGFLLRASLEPLKVKFTNILDLLESKYPGISDLIRNNPKWDLNDIWLMHLSGELAARLKYE